MSSDQEKCISNNDINWSTKRTHDYNFPKAIVTVYGLYKKQNDIPKLYISENSYMFPLDKYCSIDTPENSYAINKK